MKRKLVSYEEFEDMKAASLSTAVKELVEAEEHLAKALEEEHLQLSSFNTESVIYETSNGEFYKADYVVDGKNIRFDNVEQLVINEESETIARKKILSDMLEAIMDEKDSDASLKFSEYLEVASLRRKRAMDEGYARLYGSKERTGGKATPKISFRAGNKDPKKVEAARKAHRRHPGSYKKGYAKRHRHLGSEKSRRKIYKNYHPKLRSLSAGKAYTGKRKRHMNEWIVLSENVFSYLDYKNGFLAETHTNQDGTVNVSVPTSKVRNEAKVLKMQFDLLKTDLKVLREEALSLVDNVNFCTLVSNVKKFNNFSDDKGLQEAIEKVVYSFPSVLYLTQNEMSKLIGHALESVGFSNFGDEMCNFMAEGILRVAHEIYSERADKLVNIAKVESSEDKFADYQKAATKFFPALDESSERESRMFKDLFDAVSEVRGFALEFRNELVKSEATAFMGELRSIIEGEKRSDLDLAEEVCEWLYDFAETNLQMADWEVTKEPHKTTTGDHPQMAQNAKKSYSPAADASGDWGEPGGAAINGSDTSMNHGDELQHHGFSNKGGKDTWPDMTNPYKPSEAEFTMKEKGADKEDGLGSWQSGDTWSPEGESFVNPYLPKSMIPKINSDNKVD